MRDDEAWKIFSQVNEWIRFADLKATALLAVGGVLGGLLIRSVPSGCTGCQAPLALYGVAIVAVVLSTIMSLVALLPRLGRAGEPTSVFYFHHVARRYSRDPRAFAEAFMATVDDPAATTREVVAQIWANSQVARRKFRIVTYATWLIGVAMVLAGTAALLTLT